MKLLEKEETKSSDSLLKKNSGRYRAIGDTDLFCAEMHIAALSSNSIDDLKKMEETLVILKESAEKAWDSVDKNTLKEILSCVPIEISHSNALFNEIGNEAGVFYIPEYGEITGEIEIREAINSWKTNLIDIQSMIKERINSLSLDNDNNIKETELKNSNAFNDILFFLSNDVKDHGDILLKRAKDTKDTNGMLRALEKLNFKLEGFRTKEEDIVKVISPVLSNLAKWSLTVSCAISILKSRIETERTV